MDAETIKVVLGVFGGGVGATIVAIIIFIYLTPEQFEKWKSFIYLILVKVFRGFGKKYASYDIQGRLNTFTSEMRKKYPQLVQVGVQIHWTESNDADFPLREENRILIRIRKHEDQDKNFLQASMVFVASEFLKRTKTYLSENQKKSLDVFLVHKILEREKPHLVDKFFAVHYSPAAEVERIGDLLESYGMIEKVGLFFPVLVQELQNLGDKVYTKRSRNSIKEDVTKFISFLEKYSKRKLGDDLTPLVYSGSYLRCGIVIVAKRFKREIGDVEPYIRYIEKLLANKIETIYLIGQMEDGNKNFMENIITQISERDGMELLCEPFSVSAKILDSQGQRIAVNSYVAALRSSHIERTIDSEYEETYIKGADQKGIE